MYPPIQILMSSAGGTGSGLGCKITEIARGVIPGALIINQVRFMAIEA